MILFILAWSVVGCDTLTLQSDKQGAKSPRFVGISGAKILSSDETIVLKWSPPKNISNGTLVDYEVYIQEFSAAEAKSALSGSGGFLADLSLGDRTGKVFAVSDQLDPSKHGRLAKALSDGELSYEIKNVLPTSGYGFQVVAYINQKRVKGRSGVLVLSSGVLGDYQGCLAVSAVSASEVQIDFDYPDGASEVAILRDGNPIYVAYNPEETYFDRGLASQRLYEYTCEAKVGEQKYLGTQTFRVTTPDPLAELDNFEGCVGATPVDASRIKVDFEFPDGVDEMSIHRGGNEVFSALSANKVTAFTDTGLSEGSFVFL